MARYFAANTLAGFSRNQPNIVESTSAGRFDSAFVPNSVFIPATNGPFIEGRFSADATGTVWVHFEYSGVGTPNSGNSWFELVNSDGVSVMRIQSGGAITHSPQYWNGSAWVTGGTTFIQNGGPLVRYDVKFTIGNGGSIEVYQAGLLVASSSGHTVSGVTANVQRLRFRAWDTSGSHISQVLAADFDTRDSRYRMPAINGNGALTDGTGGFGDISETVLDETTAIVLPSATQRKTFTKASVTVPSGYRIGSVHIGSRSRRTSPVTDGQHSLRLGGVNYDSASLGLTSGYEPRQSQWETNPSTSGAWTQTDFNAAEVGVEAV